jgi:hypothetical protein
MPPLWPPRWWTRRFLWSGFNEQEGDPQAERAPHAAPKQFSLRYVRHAQAP